MESWVMIQDILWLFPLSVVAQNTASSVWSENIFCSGTSPHYHMWLFSGVLVIGHQLILGIGLMHSWYQTTSCLHRAHHIKFIVTDREGLLNRMHGLAQTFMVCSVRSVIKIHSQYPEIEIYKGHLYTCVLTVTVRCAVVVRNEIYAFSCENCKIYFTA